MKLKDYLGLLAEGGPGFVQLALTNACNAHCSFCSFSRLDSSQWLMAPWERLQQGLAALAAGGVRFLVVTGGEPLLYPHLHPALALARRLGLVTLLCTNGWLLTAEKINLLAEAGVSHLIISIDAATAEAHDTHRGLPGLAAHIRRQLPLVKAAGLVPLPRSPSAAWCRTSSAWEDSWPSWASPWSPFLIRSVSCTPAI